jgi:putative transposase
VLWPRGDGDLSDFMRWLTLTHTQRWHARHVSAGSGHLYQGRFRSLPIQGDRHLVTVCRYVERNAVQAGLTPRTQDWRWGSLWAAAQRKAAGEVAEETPAMSAWPIRRPARWVDRVNTALGPAEEEALRRSLLRGQPFGAPDWRDETAARLGLESTLRPRGRPRKDGNAGS